MIAKIILGTDIKSAFDYINRDGSLPVQIGDAMGDVPRDLQLSILNDAVSQNHRLKKNVFHAIISLEPGQQLKDREWQNIGDGFMNHMGFENAPYVMVRHQNTDKQHIHLVASRVDYDGKTVSDSQSYQKAMVYMREVEKDYNLQVLETPTLYKKEKNKSSQELYSEKKGNKHLKNFIKDNIRQALSNARGSNFNNFKKDFIGILIGNNISVIEHQYKNGKVYGMSFETNDKTFKSSQLGKEFQFEQLATSLLESFMKNHSKGKESTPRVEPSNDFAPSSSIYLGPSGTIRHSSDEDEDEEEKYKRKKKKKRGRGR
ncbi:relaxase/mobilization nuclease domain-containing protein [Reichenbachiella sp.]|uniref:relaxase/mobilization nuclease domain-containing protein n=1 Tax=Reichenbachiella sp. TaxID=2184521 RepID=UPI00329730A6